MCPRTLASDLACAMYDSWTEMKNSTGGEKKTTTTNIVPFCDFSLNKDTRGSIFRADGATEGEDERHRAEHWVNTNRAQSKDWRPSDGGVEGGRGRGGGGYGWRETVRERMESCGVLEFRAGSQTNLAHTGLNTQTYWLWFPSHVLLVPSLSDTTAPTPSCPFQTA